MTKKVCKTTVFIMMFVTAAVQPPLRAEDQPAREDFFEMSIEELMDIEVVSASRQTQKITESSVPVSIITAEDIHQSGLTSIPEILQFVPGVDVRRIDRSRYAVGVRGLFSRFSDRTLILINGRSANDPVFGAPDWTSLPLLVEDIERIEVVRGPAGAAWGANAVTGVINIITKKPEDVPGYLASTTINEFGDTYTHLRWADKKDKWNWRLSAGYEDLEDSDAAGAGRYTSAFPALDFLTGFNTYSARDFVRNWRFDTEATYQYSDRTKLSFGAGHTNFESGSNEWVGYYPQNNDTTSLTRPFVRIDHKFNEKTTGYLQWYGNFLVSHIPSTIARYADNENHIEGQLNFNPVGRHNISVGGNLSWLQVNTKSSGNSNELVFAGEPYSQRWGGVFLIDRFKATERLTLEGQIRTDFHSEYKEDWSTRLSAIYALDQAKNHTLRFSLARAFRIPTISIQNTTKTSVSGILNNVTPQSNMHNEHIWSLEGGYTGRFAKGISFSANSYYQRFEHMIGGTNTTVGPVTNTVFGNVNGATAYGAECELALENNKRKLSAWYAYNALKTDDYGQIVRALWPATHKAGVTSRLYLPDDWTFNTNYVFNSAAMSTKDFPDTCTSNRFDLTVAKKIAKGRGELMLGVSDLLNKTNKTTFGVGDLSGHETPGRTFFIRLQLRF